MERHFYIDHAGKTLVTLAYVNLRSHKSEENCAISEKKIVMVYVDIVEPVLLTFCEEHCYVFGIRRHSARKER